MCVALCECVHWGEGVGVYVCVCVCVQARSITFSVQLEMISKQMHQLVKLFLRDSSQFWLRKNIW